jgi:hypothetical protein
MGEKPMGSAAAWTEDDEDSGAAEIAIKQQGIQREAEATKAAGAMKAADARKAADATKAAGETVPAEPAAVDDPGAGAAGINTTRDNIRHGAAATPGVGAVGPGDPPAVDGDPVPGLDVR